jgi:hypothetical protein
MQPQKPLYDYSIIGVRHRRADVMLDVELGEVEVGGQLRWFGKVVLPKGRRHALPGGAVPAGARLAHQALLTAVSDQVQAVAPQIILDGLQPPAEPTGDLFQG